GDTVNLDFVRNVVGKSRVAGGAVVCRTPNGFPLPNGFRALPPTQYSRRRPCLALLNRNVYPDFWSAAFFRPESVARRHCTTSTGSLTCRFTQGIEMLPTARTRFVNPVCRKSS
ncbi:MAG: hypothetical protein ABR881_31820, partial [Candidatus Sulfotelmatobacter sp.]